ncbi:hypothetical protein MMC16_006693 [Acarospora aff. strigata]|nr:hypothetical protein [Acarospora aff. strigata]
MNPAGRAILKAADYIPALDMPSEEFPLQLSTGRQVYHFHTWTKTGWLKHLQQASPAPFIEMSAGDAAAANVKDGEDVVVRSRRGMVEMPVSIGKIAKGQVFIPFHYGYWDAPDDRARAANELTQGKQVLSPPRSKLLPLLNLYPLFCVEQWDPISKQPMFESGSIRIEKLTADPSTGTVQIHAKQQQTPTVHAVERRKPSAHAIADSTPRERHLEFHMGATYEAITSCSKSTTSSSRN